MARRNTLQERSRCLSILDLSEGASDDEIRKAYKKLALQFHPDKNSSDGAKEKFQEIGYAYKYLTEGPCAFQTEDHFVPEDILIRIFEEMFFPRSYGFGNYFDFMFMDSDDDYFYVISDDDDESDEDSYFGAFSGTKQYQNRYPGPNRTGPTQHPPSKKKKNKRKKGRNRGSTSTQQPNASGKQETGPQQGKTSTASRESTAHQHDTTNRQKTETQYTDGAAMTETKSVDGDKSESPRESSERTGQNESIQQKLNKKQKKKLESEQRKREKEMEEIAVEILQNQEKERQRQEREREKLASKRRDEVATEETNNEIYWFNDTKKSKRSRKNERKRKAQMQTVNNNGDMDSVTTSERNTPVELEPGEKLDQNYSVSFNPLQNQAPLRPPSSVPYRDQNSPHASNVAYTNNSRRQEPFSGHQQPVRSGENLHLANQTYTRTDDLEWQQQPNNLHQGHVPVKQPGFRVTGPPSSQCRLDDLEMENGHYNSGQANLNLSNASSETIRDYINGHHVNPSTSNTGSHQKAGNRGQKENSRGCYHQSRSNRGSSYKRDDRVFYSSRGNIYAQGERGGQSQTSYRPYESWYENIGGPPPSFGPNHMTDPYTYQPYKQGMHQRGSGRGDWDTRRGGYYDHSTEDWGNSGRGGRRDGYLNHTMEDWGGPNGYEYDPYGMNMQSSHSSSSGYSSREPQYDQSFRQTQAHVQHQPKSKRNQSNIGQESRYNNNCSTTDTFNKHIKSEYQSSKPNSPINSRDQPCIPEPQARDQSKPTSTESIKMENSYNQPMDSIDNIDVYSTNRTSISGGVKSAKKKKENVYKPKKSVKKETEEFDSIDDLDPISPCAGRKQYDRKSDIHASSAFKEFETKLKISDFGNSTDDILSRSKLDVPKSLFSDNIKQYYM